METETILYIIIALICVLTITFLITTIIYVKKYKNETMALADVTEKLTQATNEIKTTKASLDTCTTEKSSLQSIKTSYDDLIKKYDSAKKICGDDFGKCTTGLTKLTNISQTL